MIHFIPVLIKISTRVYEYLTPAMRSNRTIRNPNLPQSAPSKTASKLGSLGAQNPQGHYLSGPTIDFESIAVHKYAKICDCHTKGGRGSGAARANFCIIITPPTKFFAITPPADPAPSVVMSSYCLNTSHASMYFSCFALELVLCGYRDMRTAPSMAREGMMYQVGMDAT